MLVLCRSRLTQSGFWGRGSARVRLWTTTPAAALRRPTTGRRRRSDTGGAEPWAAGGRSRCQGAPRNDVNSVILTPSARLGIKQQNHHHSWRRCRLVPALSHLNSAFRSPFRPIRGKARTNRFAKISPRFKAHVLAQDPPPPIPHSRPWPAAGPPDRPTVVACSSRPLSDRRACLTCFSKPSPTVAGVVAVSMPWGVGPRPAKHCSCMLAAWTSSTTLCQRLDRAEGRTTYSAQGTIWQQTTGPRTTDTALTKS